MISPKKVLILLVSLIFLACTQTPKKSGYDGFGSDSVSKADLIRFAPKPPPADLQRKIQSMLDVRTTSTGMLTPNGKQLFFNWGVTGSSQIWKVNGPKKFPVQMTGGEVS